MPATRVTMHQKIYQDLSEQIENGILNADDVLPSELELSSRYGVSRMTVRQAIDRLAAEQLILRRRGSRTKVMARQSKFRRLNRLAPFHSELGLAEETVTTELLEATVGAPPKAVADRLRIRPRQTAVKFRRIRRVLDTPVALQESWIPSGLAVGLETEPLLGGSLYRTLRERWGIQLAYADQEISSCVAAGELVTLLRVKVGSPLLATIRVTHAAGCLPIEVAFGWTRPEYPILIRLEA